MTGAGQRCCTAPLKQAQRAYDGGTALSLNQVIDLALGGVPPGT